MTQSSRNMLWRVAAAMLAALMLAVAGAAFAGNDTYTYDAQGRLLTVSYADGSSITYTYDDVGNRTALSQSAAP